DITFISSAALSGPLQEIGTQYSRGIESYFNVINDNGGIDGHKIKFRILDDQYEPINTQQNIEKLIAENKNIYAILGVVGTPTSEEALKIAIKKDIPFLMPFSGADFLYNSKYKNLFTLRPSYQQEANEMVKYLTENNLTKIAIFYQNDSYGLSALKAIKKATQNSNIKIVSDGVYNRNTISIRLAFDEIKKGAPQAVIMAGAYKPTNEFIAKYEKSGLRAEFLNFSFVGMDFLKVAAKNSTNKILITQATPCLDSNNSDTKEYLQNFLHYFPDAKPNSVALEGYLAAKVIVAALQKSKHINKNEFIKSLSELNLTLFDTNSLTYSKNNRNGLQKVYLLEVAK
ncbi:MAG: hypothetical protein RL154_582, partial [Pseudomonadota bacterium]